MPQWRLPVHVRLSIGLELMGIDLDQMFEKRIPTQNQDRKVTVREARTILIEQEIEQLLDKDASHDEAVRLAEDSRIVFLNELNKIGASSGSPQAVEVRRQGRPRDVLPIVEAATV